MINDWLFSDEKRICHFRVAGVLLRNGKIFLQSEKDVYALPGGHVNFGETAENALVRELKEEAGASVSCERLLWVEENFWKWGDKDAHGISFYYLMSLTDDTTLPDDFAEYVKDNENVMLKWFPIEDIKNIAIYPQFIKDKINNLSEHVEHFVRNSWDKGLGS